MAAGWPILVNKLQKSKAFIVDVVLLSLLCVDICILDCDTGVLDYLLHSYLVYSVIVDVVIFGTILTLQLNAYFLYALYHWVCFIHLCLAGHFP